MEIKRPMIGVIPLVDEERESYRMLPGYMKALEQAGAVYMPDKRFVWAVQWHPEFSYKKDEAARKIFAAFAAACNKTIKETG